MQFNSTQIKRRTLKVNNVTLNEVLFFLKVSAWKSGESIFKAGAETYAKSLQMLCLLGIGDGIDMSSFH
jgi:hypothetical protein